MSSCIGRSRALGRASQPGPRMKLGQTHPERRNSIREIGSPNSYVSSGTLTNWMLHMTRLAIFLASLSIGAASIPALASQCTSPSEIAASRTRRVVIRQQLLNTTDHEVACRAFAAAFVELVMARRVAATCVREAPRFRHQCARRRNECGQRFNCRQVSGLMWERFQEVSQR